MKLLLRHGPVYSSPPIGLCGISRPIKSFIHRIHTRIYTYNGTRTDKNPSKPTPISIRIYNIYRIHPISGIQIRT